MENFSPCLSHCNKIPLTGLFINNRSLFRIVLESGGFPCGSASKESACKAGAQGSIPGLGRSPAGGKDLPTTVFWPGEFHELYIVHGIAKSRTRLSDFRFHFTFTGVWKSKIRVSAGRGLSSLFIAGAFSLSSHGQRGKGALWNLLIRALTNPIHRAFTLMTQSLPTGPSPNTTTLGDRFQHRDLGTGQRAHTDCSQEREG